MNTGYRLQIRSILGHAGHSEAAARQASRSTTGRRPHNHRPFAFGNRSSHHGRRTRTYNGPIGPSDPREIDHEAIFRKYYDKFLKQVSIILIFVGIIFLILLITTQITKDNFESGIYALQGCLGLYIIYLLRKNILNPKRRGKGKAGHKVLETCV